MQERQGKLEQLFISPQELAERWRMSRTGAMRIAERAYISSAFLGGVPGGSRRFRLADIEAFERTVTMTK